MNHKNNWQDDREMSVLATGSFYPGEPISSSDLVKQIDRIFSLEIEKRGLLIAKKLNINSRHFVRDFLAIKEEPRQGNNNPELAAQAIKKALKTAGLKINDIGYLISHSATPMHNLPSNAAFVAELLNYHGPYAEFRQACTGFINALIMAAGLLTKPNSRPVIIVGSETGSTFLNPLKTQKDNGQLVNLMQMGDGAGAIILAPKNTSKSCIKNIAHGQCGVGKKSGLIMENGGSKFPFTADILEFTHDFSLIKKHGLDLILQSLKALELNGVNSADVDYILPHQANGIMELLLKDYFSSSSKIIVEASNVGNTGSAAIWLGLDSVRKNLKNKEKVLVLGAEATKYMYGGFLYEHY